MTQTLQLSPAIIKLQEEISDLEKELGKLILEQDEELDLHLTRGHKSRQQTRLQAIKKDHRLKQWF